MLRMIFTATDLARVRVASAPDHLWETANSLQTLQRRDGTAVFGGWRKQLRGRLSGAGRRLSPLLPPSGYSPDFLTPAGANGSLEAAVAMVLRTPRERLFHDMERLGGRAFRGESRWLEALAAGATRSLDALGDALRSYHQEALAPFWPRVHAHVDADRAVRLRTLLNSGVEGLLAGLGPQIRWRPPVLEVDYPVNQVLRLAGRGLTLQPSFFCWPAPVSLADPELAPVLVYPIAHDPDWWQLDPRPATARPDALSGLLGATRAAVLRGARNGCSTGELAQLLGVSGPAVSQHVSVLREAGLLVTTRQQGRPLHVASGAGRALLQTAERGSLQ